MYSSLQGRFLFPKGNLLILNQQRSNVTASFSTYIRLFFQVEDDAFEGLQSLEYLDISDNKVLSLPAAALGRLLEDHGYHSECV